VPSTVSGGMELVDFGFLSGAAGAGRDEKRFNRRCIRLNVKSTRDSLTDPRLSPRLPGPTALAMVSS
jgi:hypothetical protein